MGSPPSSTHIYFIEEVKENKHERKKGIKMKTNKTIYDYESMLFNVMHGGGYTLVDGYAIDYPDGYQVSYKDVYSGANLQKAAEVIYTLGFSEGRKSYPLKAQKNHVTNISTMCWFWCFSGWYLSTKWSFLFELLYRFPRSE